MEHMGKYTSLSRSKEKPVGFRNNHSLVGLFYDGIFLFPLGFGIKNNSTVSLSPTCGVKPLFNEKKHKISVEMSGAFVLEYKKSGIKNGNTVLESDGFVVKPENSVPGNGSPVFGNDGSVVKPESSVLENDGSVVKHESFVPGNDYTGLEFFGKVFQPPTKGKRGFQISQSHTYITDSMNDKINTTN